MRFVETPVFTEDITRLLSDEAYCALQWALVCRPEAGALIPQGQGLRKLRWPEPGAGKRGGLRVIYYLNGQAGGDTINLLFVYRKRDQDDLTMDQLRRLGRLVRENLQ